MLSVRHIEHALVGWHKGVPHISTDYRNWLVGQSWRITVVGAIMSVYSLFVIIPHLVTALASTPAVNIIAPNVPYDDNLSGFAWIALLICAIVFL